jgi:acetylglutamate kinase
MGQVTHVNHELLEVLLEKHYVPVVSPVGLGEEGEGYCIDADEVAAEIAVAVRAEKLIYLTDVAGILDNGELVSELSSAQLRQKLQDGTLTGGMLTKAKSVLRALEAGVASAHILDGRTPHSVIAELFTDRGVGTLVRRE